MVARSQRVIFFIRKKVPSKSNRSAGDQLQAIDHLNHILLTNFNGKECDTSAHF